MHTNPYTLAPLERYTFWRNNLLEAQAFWATVNPDNVDLNTWRDPDGDEEVASDYSVAPSCGTLCCFGGWLAWAPYFQGLGLRASPITGQPLMDFADYGVSGCGVANRLFGRFALFDSASYDEADQYGSDYDIVAARIRNQLAEVDEVLAEL